MKEIQYRIASSIHKGGKWHSKRHKLKLEDEILHKNTEQGQVCTIRYWLETRLSIQKPEVE